MDKGLPGRKMLDSCLHAASQSCGEKVLGFEA